MPTWAEFPVEILDNIFQRISEKDSKNHSLVCRAWKLPAQRILFKNIPRLNDEQMREFAAALSQYSPNQTPANFVKTLNCYNITSDFDIASLNILFPFLEAINIDSCQQLLYLRIRSLVLDGLFPHLQKMPCIKWDEDHIELILSRKESIKNLELESQFFDGVPREMFEKLNQFPKLTSLKVLYNSNKAEMQFLERFLANAPPTLKTIDFHFDSTVELYNPSIPESDIQPLTNIEEVKLAGNFLYLGGEEAYVYMMKKFPDLKILDVGFETNSALDDQDYKLPSATCLTQFLIYLFNIKKSCSVPSIITDSRTIETIKEFQDYVISQKLSGSANIEFNFKIEFTVSDTWFVPRFAPGLTAFVVPRIKHHFNKKICEIKVVYKVNCGDPHLGLLEEVGNMDVETLTLGHYLQRDSKYQVSVPLETIFYRWKKLKKLRINGSTSITGI